MGSIIFQGNKQRAPHNLGLRLASMLLLAANWWAIPTTFAQEKGALGPSKQSSTTAHTNYQINLKLDFDGRSYTGTERERWINDDNCPTSVLYFHLYANLRIDQEDILSTYIIAVNVDETAS